MNGPYLFNLNPLYPFEKGVALHLKERESPSPKNAPCQVWLKLAKWFWRNIFKNSSECIFTISLSSPLRIGCLPLFEQSGIPHHSRMLCAKFG